MSRASATVRTYVETYADSVVARTTIGDEGVDYTVERGGEVVWAAHVAMTPFSNPANLAARQKATQEQGAMAQRLATAASDAPPETPMKGHPA